MSACSPASPSPPRFPAAVISMAVLPLFGRSNILENNIVATGASAGTSISAGAIFTLPALILLHHWTSFDYWWTLTIVGLGGLLGVLFSVPLRRTLIIEQKLLFPEGVAAAAVLKVGANPARGSQISRLGGHRRRRIQIHHLGTAVSAGDLHRSRVSSASAVSPFSVMASLRRCSASATSSDSMSRS